MLIGMHDGRYNGRPGVGRQLLSLARLAEGSEARGQSDPEIGDLGKKVRVTHDRMNDAYLRLRAAEAELKEANAACAQPYEVSAALYKRYAGHAYALVGEDARELNDLGLRLAPPRRRKPTEASLPTPSETTNENHPTPTPPEEVNREQDHEQR
jgi:hypothetical protein